MPAVAVDQVVVTVAQQHQILQLGQPEMPPEMNMMGVTPGDRTITTRRTGNHHRVLRWPGTGSPARCVLLARTTRSCSRHGSPGGSHNHTTTSRPSMCAGGCDHWSSHRHRSVRVSASTISSTCGRRRRVPVRSWLALKNAHTSTSASALRRDDVTGVAACRPRSRRCGSPAGTGQRRHHRARTGPPDHRQYGRCVHSRYRFDRFRQLDQSFGTLPPHTGCLFGVSNRQPSHDPDQLGLLSVHDRFDRGRAAGLQRRDLTGGQAPPRTRLWRRPGTCRGTGHDGPARWRRGSTSDNGDEARKPSTPTHPPPTHHTPPTVAPRARDGPIHAHERPRHR